jgi:hypothetical protein
MNTPSLRDPAGLLARGPELARLADRCPPLRAAIERGRAHDAYRALFWAHKRGKLGDLAQTAASLLERRRIFFKPLTGRPVMITFNSVGTSLYGRSDVDPQDGTYVATLFIVVAFVPIFPIGSYLVRDAASSGARRAWNFLAKVPLEATTYFWQRALAALMLLLIAFGAAQAFEGYGHNTLYVANGLEHDVRVQVERVGGKGKPLEAIVPAGGKTSLRLAVGTHAVAVRDDKRVLEQGRVDLPRGRGTVVWNVLGAAPVYVGHARYVDTSKPDQGADDGELDVHCGEQSFTLQGIDDVFTEPPKSVSIPKGSTSVVRKVLGLAAGGFDACVRGLLARGRLADASRVVLAVETAERRPASKLSPQEAQLLSRGSFAESEAFAKELLSRDDSVLAHRLYQDVLFFNGERARARAEYDARRAARPNDPDAAYLALRTRPLAEERSAIDALVAKYPDHAFLRRVQLYVYYARPELSQVLAAAEALRRLDPAAWSDLLTEHVDALVGLGRGAEAASLASEVAADSSLSPETRKQARMLRYRVAHWLGTPLPEGKPEEGETADYALFVRGLAGEELTSAQVELVKDPTLKRALRVARAAQAAPGTATDLARQAGKEGLETVPPSVRMLLIAESARREETRALVPALAGDTYPKPMLDSLLAYVTEGRALAEGAESLPLELRAAVAFVRSRVAGISPAEKAAALDLAKRLDVLRGPVSVAIAAWAP